MSTQTVNLAGFEDAFNAAKADFIGKNGVARFWAKDGSLWKDDEATKAFIPQFMGWIDCPTNMKRDHLADVLAFVDDVRASGFTQVVLAGMGGSSLAPLVFGSLFPQTGLKLFVVDSTHPDDLKACSAQLDWDHVLVVVASKSGTTAEPNAFNEYFYAQLQEKLGQRAARSMVVITDPGSKMQEMAEGRGYRKVFKNDPEIGGRYSALSLFGIVPAALAGVDVSRLLDLAEKFGQDHAEGGPAFELGIALGALALNGRDKLTFCTAQPHLNLGLWMEQLVAESTGKDGKGILPIATEALASSGSYGTDRVFASVTVAGDESLEGALGSLEAAGHPVIRCQMDSLEELGAEMMRWEIATATAGAVIGINPFDQPNVQEAKDITKRYIDAVRTSGALPTPEASGTGKDYALYGGSTSIAEFLQTVKRGDYIAILSFTPSGDPEIEKALQTARLAMRDKYKVATTMGYGPRYLHSTGQFHKGGPNTGVFLMISHHPLPLELPGESFGFESFVQAQAMGDADTLAKHDRRVLRIHCASESVIQAVSQEIIALCTNEN